MLPPLLLNIVLAPMYPLERPPRITGLRATNLWMPHVSSLEQILLEMYQPGQGVLYDWVECIRSGDFLRRVGLVQDGVITYVSCSPFLFSLNQSLTTAVGYLIQHLTFYYRILRPTKFPANPPHSHKIPTNARYAWNTTKAPNVYSSLAGMFSVVHVWRTSGSYASGKERFHELAAQTRNV